jgi:hypothetical protein
VVSDQSMAENPRPSFTTTPRMPPVADEYVGAAAEERHTHARGPRPGQDLGQLRGRFRHGEHVRGTADPHRRVPCQRLVDADPGPEHRPQLRHEAIGVLRRHRG